MWGHASFSWISLFFSENVSFDELKSFMSFDEKFWEWSFCRRWILMQKIMFTKGKQIQITWGTMTAHFFDNSLTFQMSLVQTLAQENISFDELKSFVDLKSCRYPSTGPQNSWKAILFPTKIIISLSSRTCKLYFNPWNHFKE